MKIELIELYLKLGMFLVLLLGRLYGSYLYFFTDQTQAGINTYLFCAIWGNSLTYSKEKK